MTVINFKIQTETFKIKFSKTDRLIFTATTSITRKLGLPTEYVNMIYKIQFYSYLKIILIRPYDELKNKGTAK